MTLTFNQICRDYLASRGESPDLLPLLDEGEDSAVLTLSDQLRVQLPAMALDATLATPAVFQDEIQAVESIPESVDNGTLIFRMPDDYLKLHSLKMADWEEDVTEVEPADSLRYALGANAPEWMVCAERPMVKEVRDSLGIALHVYGSRRQGRAEQLLYVPRPAFDGEHLTISRAAYLTLLKNLRNLQ